MSENEKNPIPGELISEEQLDAVSGGSGSASDPTQSKYCWFRADGGPREDGRTRCQAECKGKLDSDGLTINVFEDLNKFEWADWYICRCWGSDNCVDKWHKPCGHTGRWSGVPA